MTAPKEPVAVFLAISLPIAELKSSVPKVAQGRPSNTSAVIFHATDHIAFDLFPQSSLTSVWPILGVFGSLFKVVLDLGLELFRTESRNTITLISSFDLLRPVAEINFAGLVVGSRAEELQHVFGATKNIATHVTGVAEIAWPGQDVKVHGHRSRPSETQMTIHSVIANDLNLMLGDVAREGFDIESHQFSLGTWAIR